MSAPDVFDQEMDALASAVGAWLMQLRMEPPYSFDLLRGMAVVMMSMQENFPLAGNGTQPTDADVMRFETVTQALWNRLG